MARSGCRPAVCGGPSGREDSFGRRRRAADTGKTSLAPGESESKVEIREMFRVYESRENIPSQESGLVTATQVEAVVCLSARSHQALVGGLVVCCLLLLTTAATVYLQYRRGRREQAKQLADFHQPHLPQPQVDTVTPTQPHCCGRCGTPSSRSSATCRGRTASRSCSHPSPPCRATGQPSRTPANPSTPTPHYSKGERGQTAVHRIRSYITKFYKSIHFKM